MSSELAAKIVKQVEFYFSDVNVSKDTFLKSKMAESAEGFVSIATLLTFKRLASFVEGQAHPEKLIAECLADNATVVVDPVALAVRRREALPESIAIEEATVYAKPVPPTATLEELQDFFGKFGPVRAVWRRPLPGAKASSGSAAFKDSVFIVFDSAATALKICAAPPTGFGLEQPLTVMTKANYLGTKCEKKPASSGNGRDAAPAREAIVRTPPMPTNASISVSGVDKFEGFKAVKGLWPADLQAGIRYVSINDAADVATIIFQDAATADRMIADVAAKGATLNGRVPVIKRLGADEDQAATSAAEKEIAERAANRPQMNGRGGGRGRGGFRGGRGGGMRGKRDRD